MGIKDYSMIAPYAKVVNTIDQPHSLTEDKTADTQDGLSIYRKDSLTREAFPDKVGLENPVWRSLSTKAQDEYTRHEHVAPFINKYKVAELAFSAGIGESHQKLDWESFGNWRTNYGIKVMSNVLLFPDNLTFSFGYDHNLEAAWEGMKPGFMNMVDGALELARLATRDETSPPTGGKFYSRFHEVPQWKGTSPVKLTSSLKFNFQFGQAGLFSGEHEVVRPILALALPLIPTGSGNYLMGPAPTKPTYLYAMALSLKKGINAQAVAAQYTASGGGLNGIVGAATELQQQIYDAIDSGVQEAASGRIGDTPVKTLYLRVGRMVVGPYTCKNISWDFDFSETDEYGFPFKGSITFSGLDSLHVANSSQFVNSFDVK